MPCARVDGTSRTERCATDWRGLAGPVAWKSSIAIRSSSSVRPSPRHELAPGLRGEHQLSVRRRGLLLPRHRGSLERKNLGLDLELAGGCVVDQPAIGHGLVFPGNKKAAVSEDREIAAAD